MNKIHQGDCIEVMKTLPENSVDAIVTDPPYGIGFMGKNWDFGVPGKTFFIEMIRVLKPGGFLLSFGGTRCYHRLVCGIEDAGFEIRDTIMWLYGSGFPKSLNIGKQIDKMNGKLGTQGKGFVTAGDDGRKSEFKQTLALRSDYGYKYEYKSEEAKEWEGWGTALKPACEPIVVARKPLSEKNVALNVLKWGTGGINIDECRVGYQSEYDKSQATPQGKCTSGTDERIGAKPNVENQERQDFKRPEQQGRFPANIILDEEAGKMLDEQSGKTRERIILKQSGDYSFNVGNTKGKRMQQQIEGKAAGASRFFYCAKASKSEGRFPANIILDEEAGKMLDEQSGIVKSGEPKMRKSLVGFGQGNVFGSGSIGNRPNGEYGDKGGASRFFYCAKANKKERNKGCEGISKKPRSTANKMMGQSGEMKTGSGKDRTTDFHNNHPTVKPIELMKYLCRLVTPKKGTVLDPFMGSGTTGIAAKLEGFSFVGIELDAEYLEIAKLRIDAYETEATLEDFVEEYTENIQEQGLEETVMVRGEERKASEFDK